MINFEIECTNVKAQKWVCRHVYSLALCLISVIGLSIPNADAAANSPHVEKFETAVALTQIATEMNSTTLSADLKSALLATARTEDLIPLKSLLARYKGSKSVIFSSTLHSLTARNVNGDVIFTVEYDEQTRDRYAINGREWIRPLKGSVLESLDSFDKAVFRSSGKTSARSFSFILEAVAAEPSSTAAKLGAYIFVVGGTGHGFDVGATAADYLAKKDVYSALIRGSNFPRDGLVEKLRSFFDVVPLAPRKVQCTPDGAKGYALISGSEVEFLTRDDLSVVVKSRGHEQKVVFTPTPSTLRNKTSDVEKKLSMIKTPVDPKRVTRQELQIVQQAYEGVLDFCDLKGPAPRTASTRRFCRSAIEAAVDLRMATLSRRVKAKRGDGTEDENHPWLVREMYVTEVSRWLRRNRAAIDAHIKELNSALIIRDQTGTLEACDDAECMTVKPYDPAGLTSYRIPPNDMEEPVKEALAFSPKRSGQSKAKIVFACPTRNEACEQVELIDGEKLHPQDFSTAHELVARANQSLDWKELDQSVSQPLSILRALGPCCRDAECRTKVVENNIKLTPTSNSKSNGVAK